MLRNVIVAKFLHVSFCAFTKEGANSIEHTVTVLIGFSRLSKDFATTSEHIDVNINEVVM